MLPRYTTFPLPLTRQDIRKRGFSDEDELIFARQVLADAVRLDKKEMAFDLRYALFQTYVSSWVNQISALAGLAPLKLERLRRRVAIKYRVISVLRKVRARLPTW